jgi:hypothetical protein
MLRVDQLKFWKKKFELSYFKLIFVLEQIYFFNISLSATSRCLQHLVACNISLLQSINISSFYSTHILISRCERLVRSDQSINISSFHPTHILIPRCERLCERSDQIRSINQHQLVLSYPHTNSTMRAIDQIRSINQHQLVLSYPHTNSTVRAAVRAIRSDQINQSTSARFILLTY